MNVEQSDALSVWKTCLVAVCVGGYVCLSKHWQYLC
jgi:hypothetical protein